MNSELKVPTVYPVETNSREGKTQLGLETVMTIGPGFFQIFLKQARFLPIMLVLPFCTCNASQTTTVFNKRLSAGVSCFAFKS